MPELQLFGLCSSMKWAHLPNAGGLYDQDPALLEAFEYIFHAQAEEEARQEAERKRKEERGRGPGASRPRGIGRR